MNESNSDANGKSLYGNCLCGAITFTVTAKGGEAGACHCKMCRRWSGSVLLSLQSTRGLQIDGEENSALYKSSDWGEYCFYKICVSKLFWHTQFQDHVSVIVGAVKEVDQLTLTSQIFINKKPDYLSFTKQTIMKTEADLIAKYASPDQSTR